MQYSAVLLSSLLLTASTVFAADWQATASAGFGAYHPLTYQAPAGTAEEGIGPRYVLNAAIGRLIGNHLAVEGAWTFQDGDFELSSGGSKTAFDANAYAVHGDLLYYFRGRHASIRPYVVGGAGAKFYHGVEPPHTRPLADFGSFRDGVDTRALLTFGGGVDWNFSHHWGLRLDVRDFATPFPTSVIVQAPGSNLSGWLQDMVATVGIRFH